MTTSANSPCPCGSGDKYKRCCQRLHLGELAQNALLLMKSRYSAYVVGDAEYIMKTTHPACEQFDAERTRWLRGIARFSRETQFLGLTIVNFTDGATSAYVTFRAQLQQNARDASFTEKSFFVLEQRWLYRSGSRA